MRFHVTQHLRQALGSITTYDLVEPAALLNEESLTGEVVGPVTLMRTDAGIIVSAKLRLGVRQRCSRCLAATEGWVAVEFQEEYLPTVDLVTGQRLSIPDDRDNFLIDSHQVLDLTEAIRQYGVMALPMQPLCRPDCANLCPSCGANLDQGACACPSAAGDTRWGALQRLAAQLQHEEGS